MKQVLFFDLDLLLDTRLATLGGIDPDIAERIISVKDDRDKYRKRLNDEFLEFGLEKGQFEKAFANRSIETLKNSRPTLFLFSMIDIIEKLIKLQFDEPHNVESIEFVINTYPYHELSESMTEAIVAAVSCRIPDYIPVTSVYMPPGSMSPFSIPNLKYTAIFMYSYNEWANAHYGLTANPEEIPAMPEITISSTVNFNDFNKLKEAIDFKNPKGEGYDPIRGLQAMWSPYFAFEAISYESTCVVDPSEITVTAEL